jgi:hypothetical protein
MVYQGPLQLQLVVDPSGVVTQPCQGLKVCMSECFVIDGSGQSLEEVMIKNNQATGIVSLTFQNTNGGKIGT